MTIDDAALLRRYADSGAQDAFTELVRRHIHFVYATALRQLHGNTALAEDVTQMVFIDLARKAARVARHPALIAWLHTATRFVVGATLRSERRRLTREHDQRAVDSVAATNESTVDWTLLQPAFDEVLAALKERERTAILLRFFEGKRLGEIGAQLGLGEAAARSCLDRALERMRLMLARRGIASTTAALHLALANQVSVAAPATLVTSVTSAVLAGAGAAGAGSVFFIMSKTTIGIASAVILAGFTTAVLEVRANRDLRAELAATQVSSQELAQLQREGGALQAALKQIGETNPDAAELARLQHRVAALNARPDGVVDAAFKPVVPMGRATPQATFVTFTAAVNAGDLDGVAGLIAFQDDTRETREAFMASLSEAVRKKYRTPERVFAAGLFNIQEGTPRDNPAVAAQVLNTQENMPGTVRVRMWIRRESGSEMDAQEKFTQTPQGWVILFRPLSYERDAAEVRGRFNPTTGDIATKR